MSIILYLFTESPLYKLTAYTFPSGVTMTSCSFPALFVPCPTAGHYISPFLLKTKIIINPTLTVLFYLNLYQCHKRTKSCIRAGGLRTLVGLLFTTTAGSGCSSMSSSSSEFFACCWSTDFSTFRVKDTFRIMAGSFP